MVKNSTLVALSRDDEDERDSKINMLTDDQQRMATKKNTMTSETQIHNEIIIPKFEAIM
jgi:hypothetical protein